MYPSNFSCKYVLDQLKKLILSGILVYYNFKKLTKENPYLSLPSKDDECLGAHAVVIFSYDDSSKFLGILNSHGFNFAADGYFYLSYEYALNSDLA